METVQLQKETRSVSLPGDALFSLPWRVICGGIILILGVACSQRVVAALENELPAAAKPRPPTQRPKPQAPAPAPLLRLEPPKMVLIPGGSFLKGSASNEPGRDRDEGEPRRINVASFFIGRTEVTQTQWQSVMGDNPSHFNQCGGDCPVDNVSWNDAKDFVRRLTEKTGQQYRLPTEAEWEYACRGGMQHRYCGSDTADEVAWYNKNSGDRTHPVARKQANGFGLYDMSGNVWEWVEDRAHYGWLTPTDGSAEERTGITTRRMHRGGAFYDDSERVRSASRIGRPVEGRYNYLGLRVARSAE